MNPDSVSVMMTTAHVSGGAPASGPIWHLLSGAAYSNFTRCDSVGSNFLGHTIIFSGPSRHFDSSQIRGRYFNADCATHAIKSPGAIYQQDNARPHTARLSQQCLQGYGVLTMACQVTRSFANRMSGTRWEDCSRRDTGEFCADAKTMAGSSTGGHK
ncbi:uncharacterized protein TNCV_881421 [Trichonephila clavipes]|nr:uncharacterized protein TNCV_881421 [Trichonephila clavipes]